MIPEARVLVVSCGFPELDEPAAGGFVRDQAAVMSRRYDVAVLVPRVAGWRQLLARSRSTGAAISREEGLTVCRATAVHPPLRPAWLARRLLRLPRDGRVGGELSNRVLDLLLGRFRDAALNGYRRLERRWGPPDLVHAHFVLPGGWIGLELARAAGVPMVLTEHSGPFEAQLETPLRRRLVRSTLDGADRVLAVSPFLAERIRDFAPEVRVDVLGNVVRDDRFTPGPPPNRDPGRPVRFLAVARLVPAKGIADLLRAGAALAGRTRRPFEIAIAGGGPERDRLERLAADLGLPPTVRFLGSLDREGVRDALRDSDVLVVPSHHETFGMAAAEAMACGRPVISTRCGGPELVVEPESGLLVGVGDPEGLASAMASVVDGSVAFDPDAIRRRTVERFGIEAFADRLGSIYDSLLDRDGAGRPTPGRPAARGRS